MSSKQTDSKQPARPRSNRKPTGRTSKQTRGKSTRSFRGFRLPHILGGLPSWALWLGAVGIIAAYVWASYHFFVTPFSFRWKALYGDPVYPSGYEVRGVDISHYQHRVDWEKLRNASIDGAPISFVFIKATEGTDWYDEYFNVNFAQARRNDIIRGVYHYFKPGSDPRKQAEFYLRQVQLEPGDLPPVLDVEESGGLTTEKLRRDVKIWLDIAEKHYGVKPILYTGYKFKLQYLSTPEFADYPYWIAHYYVQELAYKGTWAFWQYTDLGEVSGIGGKVDLNIYNGSIDDLLQLVIPEPTLE